MEIASSQFHNQHLHAALTQPSPLLAESSKSQSGFAALMTQSLPTAPTLASDSHPGSHPPVSAKPEPWPYQRNFALEQKMRPMTEQDKFADGEISDAPADAQQAMQQFVGEAFFGMMIKQMRSSVIKSDLMGNSQAQKMFEGQFDQMMVEKMAATSADQLSKPMYEQMTRLSRPQ